MSDNEQTGPSELDMLKQRARLMGITFSNNIGLEALKAKVSAKLGDEEASEEADEAEEVDEVDETEDEAEPEAEAEVNALEATAEIADQKDTVPAGGYKPQLDHDNDGKNGGSLPRAKKEEKLSPQMAKAKARSKLIKEQMKLVRCRIQNLDPKKANLPGEIFTIANRVLGTVRKFVPYGEVTDDGYHIPYILYKELESRRFLNIRTVKDRNTKQIRVDSSYAKEFAIEVLPPLTQEELDRLATAQAAAGSVE